MFQDINKSELKFSTFVITPSVFLVPSGHSGDGGDSEVSQHDEYVVRAAPRLSEPAAHVTTLRPAHTQPAPRLVTLQVRTMQPMRVLPCWGFNMASWSLFSK